MTATIRYQRSQNLGGLSLDNLVSVINSYGKLSERTPIEHIQELRKRRGVSGQDAQKIHKALLKSYNVDHGYSSNVKPAVIATIRELANRSNSFQKKDLQQWVDVSLDIINDNSIDADEVLQAAAIAFVREQWDLVLLCKKDNLQIGIVNHENLQAKVIKKCIGFINNSDPFVCGASVALVHEKWEQLTSNQKNDVFGRCIRLMDRSPDEISAALSLLRDHLPKDDWRRNDIVDKAGEFLGESNDPKVLRAAALFMTDHIQNSKANKNAKAEKLQMFFDFFRKKENLATVTAIFMRALEPLQVGGSYSQTPIASPSTNGHRPARAAQPHQPAINLAAFARPAPLSR
jgi:hypothetical protein